MGFTCSLCGEHQSNLYKVGWFEKEGKPMFAICDDCAQKFGLDDKEDATLEWKALTVERSAEALIPIIKSVIENGD